MRTLLIVESWGSQTPSCQLGRGLLVAKALGLDLTNILTSNAPSQSATTPKRPDIAEELGEPDGVKMFESDSGAGKSIFFFSPPDPRTGPPPVRPFSFI